MPSLRHSLGLIAVLVALVAPIGAISAAGQRPVRRPLEVGGARYRVSADEARRDGARVLTPAIVDRGFTFASGTDPGWRTQVLNTVATARPEARRLIGLVDGLVTLHVGETGVRGTAGITTLSDDPGYNVTVDLPMVQARLGQRGVARDLFHELGHVIDHAIVPAAMDKQLAAGIPAGYGCEQGVGGACATQDERFAESFAKWAMNDIGVDLNIGYKVMPPEPSLDAWGAPLATLR